MNIDFVRDDFRFNLRTSALIYSEDLTKVLLFNVEGRTVYLLPGGRIEELESSFDAIKREVKEELGWDNVTFSFFAVSEEFVTDKGYNNHQINIIYKGIYHGEIDEDRFKGLEGDWINFVWVSVNDANKYNIYPSGIKDYINGSSAITHFVTNLIKNND